MTSAETTLPKPFVFVLMPFDPTFDDIYKFGIKGAADDVGAYAERVDEQVFGEGILDRIFNQIAKADVVVADMTGRNANVFYEVGYAHALGKIVLLLTQNSNDIPFDLKHRQHSVYGGKIEALRKDLAPKLQWAIGEGRRRQQGIQPEAFSIRLLGTTLTRGIAPKDVPRVVGTVKQNWFYLPIQLRNDAVETLLGITHVYLFAHNNSLLVPCEMVEQYARPSAESLSWPVTKTVSPTRRSEPLQPFDASPIDAPDGLTSQYRLSTNFPPLPPGAIEQKGFRMMFRKSESTAEETFRLRLHSPREYHDFTFVLRAELRQAETPSAPIAASPAPSKSRNIRNATFGPSSKKKS